MADGRRHHAVRIACGLVTLTLAPVSTAVAAPPGTDYRLVFADEFNASTLDSSKWLDSYAWGRTHNHDAYMASDHVILGDGTVTLKADRTAQGGKAFTSGAITTGYTKYKFDGGYVEARMLLPTTPGSWAAFWGLDNGWPPEADIMEAPLTTDGGVNGYSNNEYHTAFHYTNSAGANASGAGKVNPASAGDLTTSYHTYGMDWVSDSSVTFYFDGAVVSSFTNQSVAQMNSMYLIFNYAVGGWPGTPSLDQWGADHSDQFKIDWVHVFQKNTGATTSNWAVNGNGNFSTAANWTAGAPKFGRQTAVFGRVGTAATANIALDPWHVFGGITFDGNATGTTAYTLGTSASQIQLSTGGTSGALPQGTAGPVVQATANSTVNQTINARLELWNDTTFKNDMTGGQTLNINGQVTGLGALNVDGVGTTVLNTANAYTGGTVIGTAQGPAVLRANADNALGTGGVVIGAAGNATTARLEVAGGRTLANNIDLRGRSNNTVGIQSVSGNNTLAGTISAGVGGNVYAIQSDSGLLTLSGSAANAAGVAVQASTGARAFTFQGAGDGLVSGRVVNGGGTVSVIKAGTGTWSLTGANAFTGSATAAAGRLVLANSGTMSGVGVYGGATLSARGNLNTANALGVSGTLDLADGAINTVSSTGTLSLTNATLNLEVGTFVSDRVTASGAATVTGTNTINLSQAPGQSITAGNSYTLVTASGGLSAADFVLGNNRPASLNFLDFTLSTPTPGALVLNVTGNQSVSRAYWTGQASTLAGDSANIWSAGSAATQSNWSTSASGATDALALPSNATEVYFTADTTPAGGPTLVTQLDSDYAIRGLFFDVSAASGATNVVLNTNGKALSIGGSGLSVVGRSSAGGTVNGTGSLIVSGSQAWANNSDTQSLTVATGVSALSGATTLTFNGTGSGGITLGGVLSNGTGTLSTVFNQAGTTTIAAANTYTGLTTVAGGVVELTSTGKLAGDVSVTGGTLRVGESTDNLASTSGLDVRSGGVVDLRRVVTGPAAGPNVFATVGRLTGNGTVTRSNSGVSTLTVGAGNQSSEFAGSIQNGAGTLALVKTGTGTLTLSGTSTHTGGMTIADNGGALRVTSNAALGNGPLTIGQGGTNAAGTLQLAGGVFVNGVTVINLATRNTSDNGGAASIENVSGNNVLAARLNINNNGGNAVNILSTSGKLTIGGNLSSTGLTSARGFDFYGAGDGEVGGVISNGTAQPTFIQKDGAGTWTLANSNTYTGGTVVNGGTLVMTGNNNFGAGAVTVNNATAILSGNNSYTGGTTVNGGRVVMASPLALGSGTINLSAGATLAVQTNGNDRQYAVNVGSNNTVNFVSDTTAAVPGINHAFNSLSAGVNVVVNVANGTNATGNTSAVTFNTVSLTSGVGAGSTTFNPTTANLNLGAISTTTNSAKTVILDGNTQANFVNGPITNGANVLTVVKADTSTWTLAASSTYTGGTTINDAGGILRVVHPSALGSGAVAIGNGGSNASGTLQIANNIAITGVPTINFASRLLSTSGGAADIDNLSGDNSISANFNINLPGGNAVNVLSTSGKLTLTGRLSSTGLSTARGYNFYGSGDGAVSGVISNGTAQQTFVQKAGSGTWVLSGSNTYSGTTTIAGGTLRTSGGATANLLNNSGGTDLTGNGATLALDYAGGASPVDTVKALLTNSYANNFASGQIRSTNAAGSRGLGYGDNGSTVTIMATLLGDATLDGTVDFNDFLVLQNNFGQSGTRFDQGNFNYDGTTDFNDFLVLQNNFGQSLFGSATAATSEQIAAMTAFANNPANAAVPEPASVAVVGLAAAGLMTRRRRAV